jgi:hypothetical protein
MNLNRRSFLCGAGAVAAGAALGPLIKIREARGETQFKAKRVVIVSIAGGLRLRESLGMAEGATMPNLFGDVPLIGGFGAEAAGPTRIAPEYEALAPGLVMPAPRAVPLFTEGALVTNLRYAEGAPGHLQGAACLVSGAYNNIDNRADAAAPSPTLFELHRRQANAPATDAWYVSVVGGFYRAIQSSAHPDFGRRFGGAWLSPPGVMSPLVPIIGSGARSLDLPGSDLPTIVSPPGESSAVRRLTSVLDGNTRGYEEDGVFRATPAENASLEEHLAALYADPTYGALFPQGFGIGTARAGGGIDATGDALTTYHAEEILRRFKPKVMAMSLIDVDACHDDYNAYLRGQLAADACVRHLWEMIESTEGLAGETALLVLPEHGRQLTYNGNNPDSYGRSGLDHGGGDDGDRDVWMLALGPDFKSGVYEKTGVTQTGRTSGRYETIDAVMTAASMLGYGDLMGSSLTELGHRPGLLMEDILR